MEVGLDIGVAEPTGIDAQPVAKMNRPDSRWRGSHFRNLFLAIPTPLGRSPGLEIQDDLVDD
jgi:hypothetical protein